MFENSKRVPCPIEKLGYVDKRRAKIGLGTLNVYLKERFNIDWNVTQKLSDHLRKHRLLIILSQFEIL